MAPTSYAPALGATVHQMLIKPSFDLLEPREKLYAHHMARASWHGSRIIMRQVSAESPDIFDFIMDLITDGELQAFLEYAGTFLCNLGNYYGEGDRKFVSDLTPDVLQKVATISAAATERLSAIMQPLLAVPPFGLGYPNDNAASAYYPGTERISHEEVAKESKVMAAHAIEPENTRLQKFVVGVKPLYHVLQASVETDERPQPLANDVYLVRGDYSKELRSVVSSLGEASKYVANDKQSAFLSHYIETFQTGHLDAFRKSQKIWVTDQAARAEHVIGFVESYRDPAGIRSEWEALVGIADKDEVARLKCLVESSDIFIRQLPWAVEGVNDGKGPFEKSLFEAPDFTSLHALAVCGSVVFEACNLPNYNDIRETVGCKNNVLASRLSVNNNPNLPCPWVDPSELQRFKRTTHINPPISPLTKQPVDLHYLPSQSWGSVFGKLAGTVEECRAILIPKYLMDNKQLLEIFGYTDSSDITADKLLYATYLNIGVDGLQALQHYSFENQAWGGPHHQAHFSIFKHLLQDGSGVIRVDHNPSSSNLTVRVDKSKMQSHGKPALSKYLCCLHMWRCTADVSSCKELYEALCAVDGDYEEWRKMVCSKPSTKWKFVQPNTFLNGDSVEMKVSDESNEGIIQSWAERNI
ncbi:putative dipeptidyl peptidase 3 [Beauveria bassiana]|uniref:Putative dipeptidyl peptidase 3 n=1 Tax=Beauveria bassiana TaxID=176275 RepID=A0A2N6P0W6_BEABA|nr:putative dipeptidyl peptidase 3 [Beauveria bassiana]